jgi:hypothetical protein
MAPARLAIIDHVCEPGGQHGDDLWGHAENAVWIQDGATGVSAVRMLPDAPSDAAWLVAAMDRELRAADWGEPVQRVLQAAATTVAARFRAEAHDIAADTSTWPAASIAIVRLAADAVELVNLGDCKLLFRHADGGPTQAFGSSAVTALDRQLVRHMVAVQSEGPIEPDALWQRLVPLIQQGRLLRNVDGGYWVLDIPGRGLDHVQRVMLPAEQFGHVLLMTDGFYRLVDTYDAYADAGLLDAALSRGLAELLEELRSIEARDPRCTAFPRIKARDDATAVLARIEL